MVLIKEHAQKVKPPRMLSVPFNFGHTLGLANNPDYQHKVLKATFDLLKKDKGPVLEEFESTFVSDVIVQGSQTVNTSQKLGIQPTAEFNSLKANYEEWLNTNEGRSGVGISTIAWQDFVDIIEFLQDYTSGEVTDTNMRPTQYSVPHFIRYCVDDLKTFYFESKMAKQPDSKVNELHEWFWSKTAIGMLITELAQRMNDDVDKETKSVSFGIAR